MDKIEVSQRAREAAADHHWPLCNAFGPTPLGCSCGIEDTFARFERDILATRTGVAPVAWHSPLGGLIEAQQIARQAYKDIERDKAINGHVPGNPYDVALAGLNSVLGCLAELVTHPPATDVAALVEADLDWRVVARLAGEHGIRYRTNKALVQFLAALAPFTKGQP